MIELSDMAKLTCFVSERSTTTFISNWKPLVVFFFFAEKKEKKNELVIYGSED